MNAPAASCPSLSLALPFLDAAQIPNFFSSAEIFSVLGQVALSFWFAVHFVAVDFCLFVCFEIVIAPPAAPTQLEINEISGDLNVNKYGEVELRGHGLVVGLAVLC